MRRRFPSILVLAASLLLAGCSTVEFAYNNAPSYLAGEFDDAFDLDDPQQEQLDRSMQDFFAWHRQHELARYRRFLEGSANTIEDGVTAEEFLAISLELRHAWERSISRASRDFADLLATLSTAQIDHFDAFFREESEDYDDYLAMNAEERGAFRVEQGLELLEDWFGEFSERQREAVSARLLHLPEFYPAWIRYREARHQALVDALRKAPDRGFSAQQLQAIMLDPDSDYARAFQPPREAYWHAYAEMIEDLSGQLTSMQLRHAVKRLRKYAEGVEDITRDG